MKLTLLFITVLLLSGCAAQERQSQTPALAWVDQQIETSAATLGNAQFRLHQTTANAVRPATPTVHAVTASQPKPQSLLVRPRTAPGSPAGR
ncbi:hypothetical protein J4G53_25315 [Serratia ureilytica]|uniref:hypothetical protein n=1 Tax=Serratia ureilytica TaxID=300181 RepID=UPI001AA19354|nr:hypothetical protein [Serratia ureilytica]MBO1811554.1 hypothetical protein [Serratia ureilytica]